LQDERGCEKRSAEHRSVLWKHVRSMCITKAILYRKHITKS
jgi:hypothetical protein